MPVTLLEAKKNVLDDLQMGVIDEFRKSSWLLNNLIFDEVTSPVGGGAGFIYSYARLLTESQVAFRAVNTEYTPHEVEKKLVQTQLGIFGGSFQIDRVIRDTGGIIKETQLQMQQKIKSARTLFADTVINGSIAIDPDSFDGLESWVTGSDTDITANGGGGLDLSSLTDIRNKYDDFQFQLDLWLSELDGTPSALLVNKTMKTVIQACARQAGKYTETKDDWGRAIPTYDGIPIIDAGDGLVHGTPIIPVDPVDGTSPIYAIRIGLDGFHALTTTEGMPIHVWMPDHTTAGAVKTGEVEMIAGTALKRTRSAGVLRGIKIK